MIPFGGPWEGVGLENLYFLVLIRRYFLSFNDLSAMPFHGPCRLSNQGTSAPGCTHRVPTPPLPLRVAKAGRNHLNEEITPLLPTGIGQQYSLAISNLGHATPLRGCADVNSSIN